MPYIGLGSSAAPTLTSREAALFSVTGSEIRRIFILLGKIICLKRRVSDFGFNIFVKGFSEFAYISIYPLSFAYK